MNIDEFEAVIHEVLESLPGWVHDGLHNIDVLVVDRPGEEHGPENQDLLGLYVGIPLPERGADYAAELPDVIYIFRRPHMELGLQPDELRIEIETTLIHEIAHYFSIDDVRLDEIGWG